MLSKNKHSPETFATVFSSWLLCRRGGMTIAYPIDSIDHIGQHYDEYTAVGGIKCQLEASCQSPQTIDEGKSEA